MKLQIRCLQFKIKLLPVSRARLSDQPACLHCLSMRSSSVFFALPRCARIRSRRMNMDRITAHVLLSVLVCIGRTVLAQHIADGPHGVTAKAGGVTLQVSVLRDDVLRVRMLEGRRYSGKCIVGRAARLSAQAAYQSRANLKASLPAYRSQHHRSFRAPLFCASGAFRITTQPTILFSCVYMGVAWSLT
jgi:hypothetical protein